MTGSKKERGRSPAPRSLTPTDDRKRKLQSSPRSNSPALKKIKQEQSAMAEVKPISLLNVAGSSNDKRPQTPVTAASASSARYVIY